MTVPHYNQIADGIEDVQSFGIGSVQRETISAVVYDKDIRNTLLNLGIMEKEHKSEMMRLRRCNLPGRR
jgi:hypothetical protein